MEAYHKEVSLSARGPKPQLDLDKNNNEAVKSRKFQDENHATSRLASDSSKQPSSGDNSGYMQKYIFSPNTYLTQSYEICQTYFFIY